MPYSDLLDHACAYGLCGASEISMAQWASAYVESALGISKSIGDVAVPCLFAIMMGISRSFYGKYGEKMDLMKFMIASGALCLVYYLLYFRHFLLPALNLLGCVICSFLSGSWRGHDQHCAAARSRLAERRCLRSLPWQETLAVHGRVLSALSHNAQMMI